MTTTAPAGERRPTLLIVDDQPANLELLMATLEAQHRVLFATDGSRALELARRFRPDLILLDVLMPGLDGFEVCTRLQREEATARIPVIFLTGRDREEDEARGLALGAVDYITKPFTPALVKARVATHLRLHAALAELAEKNAELERAAELREEVERITRHDLKAPLNTLLGVIELVLEEARLDPDHCELLRRAEAAGYRMLEMINRSLDLYRMETGSYQVQWVAVDLAAVVRKVVADLERHCAGRGVRAAIGGAEREVAVRGEELLLYSMCANLLTNAFQASPEGAEVAIGLEREAGAVTLRIRNRGVVPAAIRDRLFEKYVTSGKPGGTGLGTYSARLIARTLGGEIAAECSDEAGTTTVVTRFPAP